MEEAFNSAEEAFITWRKTPNEERIIFIEKAGEIIYEEMEEIAELISIETGKPLLEAYLSDLLSSFDAIEFYSKNSKKILKREIIRFNQPHLIGKKAWVEYEPFGTVAVITPWNYPFSIPITTLVPVLIAGNTVLFKPSEFTPLIGRKIKEIFDKARLPKGVLNVIFGDGSAGIEVIKKPIKKVFLLVLLPQGRK
ncbi:MAG: aldehyde dehydrogenase family protein [Candidatus Aminicenantia bacterium]